MEQKSTLRKIIEWIICIIIVFVIASFCRYFLIAISEVKMISMKPTLEQGDKLILNRTIRITKKIPKRYEIITFEAPSSVYSLKEVNEAWPIAKYENNSADSFLENKKISYIKRVIALPGERVDIKNGKVWINNKLLEEPYLKNNALTDSKKFKSFIVPDKYIFAMGDNRPESKDCRDFGCIPLKKIEGIAKFRIFPLNKIRNS